MQDPCHPNSNSTKAQWFCMTFHSWPKFLLGNNKQFFPGRKIYPKHLKWGRKQDEWIIKSPKHKRNWGVWHILYFVILGFSFIWFRNWIEQQHLILSKWGGDTIAPSFLRSSFAIYLKRVFPIQDKFGVVSEWYWGIVWMFGSYKYNTSM